MKLFSRNITYAEHCLKLDKVAGSAKYINKRKTV